MGTKVFVYGSLRKGMRLNNYLNNIGIFLEYGDVEGKLMIQPNGYFPYAIRGEGTIKGEIWSVPDWFVPEYLDVVEGYNKRKPSLSHYLRVVNDVNTSLSIQKAWMYWLNFNSYIPNLVLIEDGDFVKYYEEVISQYKDTEREELAFGSFVRGQKE